MQTKNHFSIFNVFQKIITPFYFEDLQSTFYRYEAFISGFYFDLVNQHHVMVFDLKLNKKFNVLAPAFFDMSQDRFGSIVGEQIYRKYLLLNSFNSSIFNPISHLRLRNPMGDYFPFLNQDFILKDLYNIPFELSDEVLQSTLFFSKFDSIYRRRFTFSDFDLSFYQASLLNFSWSDLAQGFFPLPLNQFPYTFLIQNFSGETSIAPLLMDQYDFWSNLSKVKRVPSLLKLIKQSFLAPNAFQLLNGLQFIYSKVLQDNLNNFISFSKNFTLILDKILLINEYAVGNFNSYLSFLFLSLLFKKQSLSKIFAFSNTKLLWQKSYRLKKNPLFILTQHKPHINAFIYFKPFTALKSNPFNRNHTSIFYLKPNRGLSTFTSPLKYFFKGFIKLFLFEFLRKNFGFVSLTSWVFNPKALLAFYFTRLNINFLSIAKKLSDQITDRYDSVNPALFSEDDNLTLPMAAVNSGWNQTLVLNILDLPWNLSWYNSILNWFIKSLFWKLNLTFEKKIKQSHKNFYKYFEKKRFSFFKKWKAKSISISLLKKKYFSWKIKFFFVFFKNWFLSRFSILSKGLKLSKVALLRHYIVTYFGKNDIADKNLNFLDDLLVLPLVVSAKVNSILGMSVSATSLPGLKIQNFSFKKMPIWCYFKGKPIIKPYKVSKTVNFVKYLNSTSKYRLFSKYICKFSGINTVGFKAFIEKMSDASKLKSRPHFRWNRKSKIFFKGKKK